MNKEITRSERIINCVNEMSSILELDRIICAKQLYKKVSNCEVTKDFTDAMLTIMIDDLVSPSKVETNILNSLVDKDIKLFRKYYNCLDEKNKVQLVSKLNCVILLFKEKHELTPEASYYGTGYSRVGSPINFIVSISDDNVYNSESVKKKYNKFVYDMVDNYMQYFFKYIELHKIADMYYAIHSLNTKTPESDYGIKAIVKRISMYQEKRISTSSLTSFIEVINDSNKTSKEVCKYLMEVLHTYIPEKIMFQIMI